MDESEFIKIHANKMAEIQKEWEENKKLHIGYNNVPEGIRSSQISALVAVLIKDKLCNQD